MEQYELIENYLSNLLTNEEKIAFEKELAINPQLTEALAMYKAINASMQQNIEGNEGLFKENLAPLQQQYFGSTTAKVVTMPNNKATVRKIIFGALSIAAVLVLVFIFVPFGGGKKTSEELYAQYNTLEKIENTTRGTETENTLQQGINFYNAKNFEAAIPIFEKIKDSSVQGKLLLGVCYVQTNAFAKGHINFDEIINGKSVFVEKAIWYKAMAYLKSKELPNCKTQLNKLLQSETYKKNATTILKNL